MGGHVTVSSSPAVGYLSESALGRRPSWPRQYQQNTRHEVPDLVGLRWRDARNLLVRSGVHAVDPDGLPLTARAVEDGVVVTQDPVAGTQISSQQAVTVWIERRPGSAGVREPRRPKPTTHQQLGMLDERTGDAV